MVRTAGQAVERLWTEISAVSCTEAVVQAKLGPRGKLLAERKAVYDYLILMQITGGELSVEESRREKPSKKEAKRAPGPPLLVTSGFAVMMLVFHPQFRSSYDFRLLPDTDWQGERVHRIAFSHVRGTHSPSALQLRGRDYPLEWAGEAWIHPATNAIVHVQAGLKQPMEMVGLLTLDAQVEYGPVPFEGVTQPYWLPQTAVIETTTRGQHWRNVHRFGSYRRFEVETTVKTQTP